VRPTRATALPVYRADLNHPVDIAEHGKAANSSSGFVTGQTSPQGGSGGQHWEDRKSQGQCVMHWICPRRFGLKWRENMWNRYVLRKQMTTDASRLMRLNAAAPWSSSAFRQHSSIAKWYSVKPRLLTAPRVAPPASAIGGGLMRA